jgi:hypothetical protein
MRLCGAEARDERQESPAVFLEGVCCGNDLAPHDALGVACALAEPADQSELVVGHQGIAKPA